MMDKKKLDKMIKYYTPKIKKGLAKEQDIFDILLSFSNSDLEALYMNYTVLIYLVMLIEAYPGAKFSPENGEQEISDKTNLLNSLINYAMLEKDGFATTKYPYKKLVLVDQEKIDTVLNKKNMPKHLQDLCEEIERLNVKA